MRAFSSLSAPCCKPPNPMKICHHTTIHPSRGLIIGENYSKYCNITSSGNNNLHSSIRYRFHSTKQIQSASNTVNPDKVDRRAYPIAFSSFLGGITMGVILPVLPQLANEISINPAQYGLVFSVTGISRLIANIPAGVFTDTFGRKSTLVGGPILSVFGNMILATATNLNQMVSSQFLGGIGGSIQMAGSQAYLSDISTLANRARTMAPTAIGMSAGMVLGPFVGGILCDSFDSSRAPFYFVACSVAAVAFNNWYNLPETLRKGDRTTKLSDMNQLFRTTWTEWKGLMKDKSTVSGVMVHTANIFAQAGAVFILLPLYATNELGVSTTQIGTVFAMMSVVNICGAQFMAKISDKYGRKKVIIPAVCIIASTLPLIPYVTAMHELYALMLIYSIGTTMVSMAPTAYIADMYSGDKEKEAIRSQALAMLRSGGDIGIMIGGGMLGYLTHASGSFMVPMCTASVVLFAAGGNFAINAKETVTRQRK